MRLTELKPRWVVDAAGRQGMGIGLLCPICKAEMIAVWFKQPLDGGPPASDQKHLWNRTGDSFDNLTLSPSIDASGPGAIPCSDPRGPDFWDSHWHGHITNGEVTP